MLRLLLLGSEGGCIAFGYGLGRLEGKMGLSWRKLGIECDILMINPDVFIGL